MPQVLRFSLAAILLGPLALAAATVLYPGVVIASDHDAARAYPNPERHRDVL